MNISIPFLPDIPMLIGMSFVFLFSLLMGGFITSLSYYLPNPHIERLQVWHQMVFLSRLRSKCPSCKHQLSFLDILPLVGFLIHKGRCHYCSKPISWRYPAIEFITAISMGACFLLFSGYLSIWMAGLVWLLILLSVIDIETRLLLDILVFPLLFLGLLFQSYFQFISLEYAVMSVIAGYLIAFSFKGLLLMLFKQDGLGEGDVKFVAASMAWIGLSAFSSLVVIAALLALAYMVLFKHKGYIPFGPFLAFSLFINATLLTYNQPFQELISHVFI
jgi:leader peptidase (prepilin peptidase)/N-methyltransferase